ncbi:MAG: hypothetical protein QE493_08225 [Verrucomicrobiae bacterium]|jgi:hypothetical protein|nr:hypothetical protein [Verrucomicrobiae bacterium]
MDATLDSHFDLGSMYTYSPASQSFARLVLISFARRLITLQYEISGLSLKFILWGRLFYVVLDLG